MRFLNLKKKLNFFNTYDFRLEASINILLRWGCLEKKGTRYFKGAEPLESVPDIATDQLIKTQQKKLLDLIQLVREKDQTSFNQKIKNYFGE